MQKLLATILFSLVAFTWGQHRRECLCGMFVAVNDASYEVQRLPSIDLDHCDDEPVCHSGCIREWEYVFDNGGLSYTRPNHTMTIGDNSCLNLALDFDTEDFRPHQLFGYYKVCDGPWIFDGEESRDHLCCKHGHYPGAEHCEQSH